MNNFNYVLALFIVLGIIFFLISLIFIFLYTKVKTKNYTDNSGLIVVNIDWKNKKIIRETNNFLSKNLPWDIGKNKLKKNIFTNVENFLNVINEKHKENIVKYFNNPTKNRYNINFNFVESLEILKNLKKINSDFNLKNFSLLLKIYKISDNNFWCTIHYHNNILNNKNYELNKLEDIKDLKNLNSRFFSSLVVNINENILDIENNYELNQIYFNILSFLKISSRKVILTKYENILLIIFNRNTLLSLKETSRKLIKKLNHLNSKFIFNEYIESVSIIEENKFFNNNDVNNFISKICFLNANLSNSLTNKNYFYWGINDYEFKKEFDEFNIKIDEFEKRNKNEDFISEIIPINIINKSNKHISNLKLLKIHLNSFNKNDFNFFKNVPYLKNRYEYSWVKYLLQNINKNDVTLIKSSNLDFSKFEFDNTSNLTFLIANVEKDFNIKKIYKIINELSKNEIGIGLYLNEISNRMINFIKTTKLFNLIMIGNNLSKNLTSNSETYLRLLNLRNGISKNIEIIYENLPNNIDPYIIEKLDIKYTVNNK